MMMTSDHLKDDYGKVDVNFSKDKWDVKVLEKMENKTLRNDKLK